MRGNHNGKPLPISIHRRIILIKFRKSGGVLLEISVRKLVCSVPTLRSSVVHISIYSKLREKLNNGISTKYRKTRSPSQNGLRKRIPVMSCAPEKTMSPKISVLRRQLSCFAILISSAKDFGGALFSGDYRNQRLISESGGVTFKLFYFLRCASVRPPFFLFFGTTHFILLVYHLP